MTNPFIYEHSVIVYIRQNVPEYRLQRISCSITMAMNLSLVCLLVTFSTLLFSIDAVEESTSPIFDVVETEPYERLPSSMIDTLKRDGRMDQLKPIRQEQQYNVSGVLTFRGPIQTMTCNETIKSMVTQICFDDESKMIINKKRQIESIQDLIAPLIKRNYGMK